MKPWIGQSTSNYLKTTKAQFYYFCSPTHQLSRRHRKNTLLLFLHPESFACATLRFFISGTNLLLLILTAQSSHSLSATVTFLDSAFTARLSTEANANRVVGFTSVTFQQRSRLFMARSAANEQNGSNKEILMGTPSKSPNPYGVYPLVPELQFGTHVLSKALFRIGVCRMPMRQLLSNFRLHRPRFRAVVKVPFYDK
jgi:hypothetical protein